MRGVVTAPVTESQVTFVVQVLPVVAIVQLFASISTSSESPPPHVGQPTEGGFTLTVIVSTALKPSGSVTLSWKVYVPRASKPVNVGESVEPPTMTEAGSLFVLDTNDQLSARLPGVSASLALAPFGEAVVVFRVIVLSIPA